jgi:hypothetical protein
MKLHDDPEIPQPEEVLKEPHHSHKLLAVA